MPVSSNSQSRKERDQGSSCANSFKKRSRIASAQETDERPTPCSPSTVRDLLAEVLDTHQGGCYVVVDGRANDWEFTYKVLGKDATETLGDGDEEAL
jgi:hypothetical protein